MAATEPTLHLVCGKIAAGKSTLCARLAAAPQTVLIGEDHWMSRLFGPDIHTVEDYVRFSARLRGPMGDHVVVLLRAGLSVVLDFPANTVAARNWMRSLFEAANAAHQLHYLDAPDETCRARMHERYARGEHAFRVTDEQFDHITRRFAQPTLEEDFNILLYPAPPQRA